MVSFPYFYTSAWQRSARNVLLFTWCCVMCQRMSKCLPFCRFGMEFLVQEGQCQILLRNIHVVWRRVHNNSDIHVCIKEGPRRTLDRQRPREKTIYITTRLSHFHCLREKGSHQERISERIACVFVLLWQASQERTCIVCRMENDISPHAPRNHTLITYYVTDIILPLMVIFLTYGGHVRMGYPSHGWFLCCKWW